MCGISFVFHSNGTRPKKNQLLRMNKALAHRGPDDSGIAIRNNAGLGHTRLSIVDVAGGAQPLYSNDNRWCIIFNGEIYNYLTLRNELKSTGVNFRTKTDTEVVLQLYIKEGPKSIQRLRGMFAFVIHDLETGQAFIARDRLGIKPFYYHWNDTTLTAGSEIKALFASGLVDPEFNQASIINYFKYQCSISPHTMFSDVYELPPGHTMALEPGAEPVISKYWEIEFPIDGEYDSGDETKWTQRFEDALTDAVQSHTIGEVPIGAYLSGGIDSATMAWMLKNQYSESFKTFSVRFTNPNQDESILFRQISEHLNISNEEIELDDQRESGFLSELEDCVYYLEQPQRIAIDIPYFMLSDLVRNQKHKVVYTGDGADEILGGYDCYRMDHIRHSGNQLDPDSQRKEYYHSEFGDSFSSDYLKMVSHLFLLQFCPIKLILLNYY
jgi:asparagine synthase (glutamine-hydrolysing)